MVDPSSSLNMCCACDGTIGVFRTAEALFALQYLLQVRTVYSDSDLDAMLGEE